MQGRTEDGPVRVLVVDDNSDVLLTTSVLLRMMGHEVHPATTGAEALREVTTFSPDLVLLDIAMPHMSGISVAQNIRALHLIKEPTLAAMTGFANIEVQKQCAQNGFDHYLVKPVETAAIDQLIRIVIADSRPRAAFL